MHATPISLLIKLCLRFHVYLPFLSKMMINLYDPSFLQAFLPKSELACRPRVSFRARMMICALLITKQCRRTFEKQTRNGCIAFVIAGRRLEHIMPQLMSWSVQWTVVSKVKVKSTALLWFPWSKSKVESDAFQLALIWMYTQTNTQLA